MKCFCPLLPLARVVSVGALLAAVTSLLGACDGGQSGAEVATGNGGGDPPGHGDPPGGDAPPPGGGDPPPTPVCETDDACREKTLQQLEWLAAPQAQSLEFSSSACEAYGLFYADRQLSGPGCTCNSAHAGHRTVGPMGGGCSFTGRGGECLVNDAEFAGCSISDPHACDATCAELAQRLTADAQRTLQMDLRYARCDQSTAGILTEDGCQSVVEIGGLCYPNYPYLMGKGYDCALGAEAILKASPAQHSELKTRPALEAYYQPGTNATVQLQVSQEYWGKARGASSFGVNAHFFDLSGKDARYGELFRDVASTDTCRVLSESPLDTPANARLLSVDRAVLRDGDREFQLQEVGSGSDSPSYSLDLSLAGAQPHPGRYGFSASGGTFAGSFELKDITLLAAPSSPVLEATSHFERGPLALTWARATPNTLDLFLDITPQLGNASGAYHIECLLSDDGNFTIPESVMAAAPDGFVTATLRRSMRASNGLHDIPGIPGGWDNPVQSIGEFLEIHHFVLGPTCDGSALMAACQRSANTIRARYQECSDVEPPPLEQLCPDYLATTCGSCPEYFDCLAASTTCGSDGLTQRAGCGCPQ